MGLTRFRRTNMGSVPDFCSRRIAWLSRYAAPSVLQQLPFYHLKQVSDDEELAGVFNGLWQEAWLRAGYATAESLPRLIAHYASYGERSSDSLLYFLSVPVGTIRLISGSEHNSKGLPVLKDFDYTLCWDRNERLVEVTLLTLRPEFQSMAHTATLHLFRALHSHAKERGVRWAVAAADRRLFVLLKRVLCGGVKQIGESREYEGSLTIPCAIDIVEALESLSRDRRDRFRLITRCI